MSAHGAHTRPTREQSSHDRSKGPAGHRMRAPVQERRPSAVTPTHTSRTGKSNRWAQRLLAMALLGTVTRAMGLCRSSGATSTMRADYRAYQILARFLVFYFTFCGLEELEGVSSRLFFLSHQTLPSLSLSLLSLSPLITLSTPPDSP